MSALIRSLVALMRLEVLSEHDCRNDCAVHCTSPKIVSCSKTGAGMQRSGAEFLGRDRKDTRLARESSC